MSEDTRSFSERERFVEPRKMQIDDLDRKTRTSIWNAYYDCFSIGSDYDRKLAYELIWTDFLSGYKDEFNYNMCECTVRNIIQDESEPWHGIFDFIEFILKQCSAIYENYDLASYFNDDNGKEFSSSINRIMEQMNVGYSLMNNQFSPIHSEQEREAIEQALDSPFNGARQHIEKSLTLFFDRESPDYENSIKESISAVESILGKVTGERKFSDSVDKLENIHPAHKQALKNLYGFTSDADGIRHGGKGSPLSVNQNTARFMLVICSAFVNYIVSENPTKIIGDIKDD